MTAEAILAAAADLVEQSWIQSPLLMNFEKGPWCAGMALNRVTGDPLEEAALVEAHAALRREIGTNGIAAWNDAPGRRMEEVATALRSAKRFL